MNDIARYLQEHESTEENINSGVFHFGETVVEELCKKAINFHDNPLKTLAR